MVESPDRSPLIDGVSTVFGPSIEPVRLYRAPGRVNLIGDHIDYLGGSVLPMALDRGTSVAVRPRSDRLLRAHSLDLPGAGIPTADLDATGFDSAHGWFSYVLGVIDTMAAAGHRLARGLDILVGGDLPHSAGLSSSASLEMATAVLVADLAAAALDPTALAVLTQRAENEYIGVACGIMDQLAIARGRRGHALLIDCATLHWRAVPFPHQDVAVIVANTNHRRSLTGSAYNERRSACEAALAAIRRRRPLDRLVDLRPADLEALGADLPAGALPRVRHAVTEQQRVLAAADALARADIGTLGTLMRASHESLRDDFEVTGPYLDALAEAAWAHPATLGARMTGAGFGGCTVNLVAPAAVADFTADVGAAYTRATGRTASFLQVGSADGARRIHP